MSTASAVDVERFHLSLNVNDLAKSVQFLTALLGCSPKKHRPDYAKFEPEELAIVLSLEPRSTPQAPLRNTAGEGPLNHVGIRMTDAVQLVEVQRRLESAGYSTQREEGVECCYARQTKFWVYDHDRTMWEVYVLDEDLEHRGGEHDELHSHHVTPASCEPVAEQRKTWMHRLSAEFPTQVPNRGELEEIVLQGSWNARRHEGHWRAQLQQVSAALVPGGKLILHLLTANEPVTNLQPLPGPAAVVEVVPLLGDLLAALSAAGFVDVQLVKYSSSPCFVQNGIAMRETRLEAYSRPQKTNLEQLVTVIYKGPATTVTDDSGNTFHRGLPSVISAHSWQRIAASNMSESFAKLAEATSEPVSCGISITK